MLDSNTLKLQKNIPNVNKILTIVRYAEDGRIIVNSDTTFVAASDT